MSIEERLDNILEPEDFLKNEPMKAYTTFRIGGPARWMVCPSDEQQLRVILQACDETQTPYFLLGRGSNLLVSDAGFDGVVINLRKHFSDIKVDSEMAVITAEAGALMPAVAQAAYAAGLGGLEFASGIPGTIGGGLFMNAGAYGGELKQVVTKATVMSRSGFIRDVKNEDMKLGHRTSCFMQTGEIILSCELKLEHRDKAQIKEMMDDFNGRRRDKQPLEFGSAGSTFKRPEGYFAGKLIEDAGLKGFCIGEAQVSEKHAGFVINRGGATAKDVFDLYNYIKETVRKNSGVDLELEVQLLGEF